MIKSHRTDSTVETFPLAIVGGGLVGLTLALALGKQGVRLAVIEPQILDKKSPKNPDIRVSALSWSTIAFLQRLGVWEHVCAPRMEGDAKHRPHLPGWIHDIRISDATPLRGDSLLHLHFSKQDTHDIVTHHTDTPRAHPPAQMGAIVENRVLHYALLEQVRALPSVTLYEGCRLEAYRAVPGYAALELEGPKGPSLLHAELAVAADGRGSCLRKQAGMDVWEHRYPQSALVCTLRHMEPHHHVAVERFLPAGPFALLPLGKKAGKEEAPFHYTSIVWTDAPDVIQAALAAERDCLTHAIQRRVGSHLGEVEVDGPVAAYPLGLQMTREMTRERVVLIGDAAHAIHPIAGQGLNLGVRDVVALQDAVLRATGLGLSAGDGSVTAAYVAHRRGDNAQMAIATDLCNRLFSNDVMPVRLARRVGLGMVEKLPAVRQRFMRYAMGLG